MASLSIKKTESIIDELKGLHERITKRAYQIFENRERTLGQDLDDWFRAEAELVWTPPIGLREANGTFILELLAPGIDPNDLDIEVTREELLVKAKSRHEQETDEGTVHISEFASTNLFRAARFPKQIDPDSVKAELKDGILRVIARIAEAEKVKVQAKAS